MQQYRMILDSAARGLLPRVIDETTDPPYDLVRELVEAGLLKAEDASTHDGRTYLAPRITLAGRTYLSTIGGPSSTRRQELVSKLERMRDLLVSVATGGARIQDVNDDYRESYRQVDEDLRQLGIQNPIPFTELWEWYGRWRSGDLPSYQSRRQFVAELFVPLLRQIRDHGSGLAPRVIELTGWPKVDRGLGETRRRLAEASTEEQFQAVGLLCREVIISLAQAVYVLEEHGSLDEVAPSSTDAKRMLEAYISSTIAGPSNAAARKHARASFDLAVDLQHRRTATFREAALCVESTGSVVNVIAILSGRRDPTT